MAKLVFFRRTPHQAAMQNGEIFFDINGRNIGRLAMTDCFVELPAGRYQIRMYMSNPYGAMIGFAETLIDLGAEETLLVRYTAPAVAHQPGHLMVAAYDAAMADRLAIEIDQGLAAEQLQQQARDEAARKSSSNAVKWIILASVGAAVTIVVCWAIIYASIYSGISSLY